MRVQHSIFLKLESVKQELREVQRDLSEKILSSSEVALVQLADRNRGRYSKNWDVVLGSITVVKLVHKKRFCS